MKDKQIDVDRFSRKKRELIDRLAFINPERLARNTSSEFSPGDSGKGEFTLTLWGKQVTLSYPDFIARDCSTAKELSQINRVLLLYYFDTADGTPVAGNWISFSELPDGKFYNQAFQGYTGKVLSRIFRNDLESFERSAAQIHGQHYPLGDSSYVFKILPRVSILVVYWLGDEDFASSFQLLFDASAGHYLPTDAYAILGSTLTSKINKSKNL